MIRTTLTGSRVLVRYSNDSSLILLSNRMDLGIRFPLRPESIVSNENAACRGRGIFRVFVIDGGQGILSGLVEITSSFWGIA